MVILRDFEDDFESYYLYVTLRSLSFKDQMKNFTFLITCFSLMIGHSYAKEDRTKELEEQLNKQGISFTENKGQVHDQNYKPRPDVLFGAMAGNMAFHLRTT
jgi:hypothetical protein